MHKGLNQEKHVVAAKLEEKSYGGGGRGESLLETTPRKLVSLDCIQYALI